MKHELSGRPLLVKDATIFQRIKMWWHFKKFQWAMRKLGQKVTLERL